MELLKTLLFTGSIYAFLLPVGTQDIAVSKSQNGSAEVQFSQRDQIIALIDSIEVSVDSLERQNRLSEAYSLAHNGLRMAEEEIYENGIFNLSLQLASQFLERNIPDSTIYYSEKALELANDDKKRKQALNSLGNGHAKAGRSIIAIDLYEKVLALADTLNNEQYSVGVLTNLATAYALQGDIDKGLQYYFEALERSEKLGNMEFIALITNNLGDKFNEMEDYTQAEYYLNRSKEISERENLRTNLLRVLLNLGNTYMGTERYEDAEKAYYSVLDYHRQSGNITGEIQVKYNLGMLHLAKEEFSAARDLLMQALEQSREINLFPGIFYSTNGLGELELKMGNIRESILRYEEGVEITTETDNRAMRLAASENMYNVHKKAGNPAEALSWLEQVRELNEEIRSTENDRLRAQYETKFDLRRSEQEKQLAEVKQQQQQAQLEQQRWIIIIALAGITILLITGVILIRTNKKRKTANLKLVDSNRQLKKLNRTVQDQKEELERLNNVKTKLFAIIAHDLRGPLGSLQSLLYLLREHDLSEEETHQLTANLEKNMLENSSMMDNLLGWAQSQMNGLSINKRNFDLRLAIQSVLDQFKLQLENKQVELIVKVPENTMIYADYDLIKLVIRNLVANAIKFSNPDSSIVIRATKENGKLYQVAIEDSGVGISKENQGKIFSGEHFTSTGTNKEKGSGLGLNLCKEYVEKHGGSIWFETEENQGTTFFFTIAASEEKELINA